MIMGYGIIAVPTGIVTAEIAKNNLIRAEKNKRICKNCASEAHTISAKYCSECGSEL
jgi:voltage-gated potassium channel